MEQLKPYAVVRKYFGDISDDACGSIMWNCTGWPSFFNTTDGKTLYECFEEQVKLAAEKSGKNVGVALYISELEMNCAMYKGEIFKVTDLIKEWIGKQGHDSCWYYPEVFREICERLDIEYTKPSLPPKDEFSEGCRKYQEELYNGTT